MKSQVMIDTPVKAVRPTLGQECATVLVLRNLIPGKDEAEVAEIISNFQANPETATHELSRRGFITEQNEAVAAEFIKRAVRRFL